MVNNTSDVQSQTGLAAQAIMGTRMSPKEFQAVVCDRIPQDSTGQYEATMHDQIMKNREMAKAEGLTPRTAFIKFSSPKPIAEECDSQTPDPKGPVTRSRKKLSELVIPDGDILELWQEDDHVTKHARI